MVLGEYNRLSKEIASGQLDSDEIFRRKIILKGLMWYYPALTFDSRRYPFPRNPKLEILRFGAIDDEPDEGVVPESGVGVIYVKGARHIDLSDRGSPEIKDEIQKSIIQFLDR